MDWKKTCFHRSSQDEKNADEALEEERRLFYVALTRAKENAWFSYANQRYRWGKLDFCSPSRFLEELEEKYIDTTSLKILQQSRSLQTVVFEMNHTTGFY